MVLIVVVIVEVSCKSCSRITAHNTHVLMIIHRRGKLGFGQQYLLVLVVEFGVMLT